MTTEDYVRRLIANGATELRVPEYPTESEDR